MEEVTFCPSCKREIQARAVQCRFCGARRAGKAMEQPTAGLGVTRTQVWLIAALLGAVVCLQGIATFGGEAAAAAPSYEYKLESPTDTSLISELDTWGRDGWALVFARRAKSRFGPMGYEVIFRRRK